MSDFKIKVTADLDTSQVEAKLMALQNRKITIQANAILWILELVSYLSASSIVSIPFSLRSTMFLWYLTFSMKYFFSP